MDDMTWVYTQALRGMTPIQIEAVAYILGKFAGKAGIPKEKGRDIMHELLDEYRALRGELK